MHQDHAGCLTMKVAEHDKRFDWIATPIDAIGQRFERDDEQLQIITMSVPQRAQAMGAPPAQG